MVQVMPWPHSAVLCYHVHSYYAHVGSGPRKRLCACGVQIEPAAWPGPAFGGGQRLRRGMLSLPAGLQATPVAVPTLSYSVMPLERGVPTCIKSGGADLSCAAATAVAAAASTAARPL
jgi:hypothetical protein